ncbi:MAG: hypothetical protein ABTA16_00360 [Niallia sp.]
MADAQKLLPTDTLRQGYPKINDAIDNANESLNKHAATDLKADEAIATANAAETKADSVQEQFNQVVIEGDSSVEAAQARVDSNNNTFATLKERLDTKEDSFTAQLATTETKVSTLAMTPAFLNEKAKVGDSVSIFIHDHGDNQDTDFSLFAELGIKNVRIDILWLKVEKTKGVYDFTDMDTVIQNCIDYGIKPLCILAYGNPLYTATNTNEMLAGYKAFVKAVAQHYSQYGLSYEIYNEPNNNSMWFDNTMTTTAKINAYFTMLKDAYTTIKQYSPNSFIVAPALSSNFGYAGDWDNYYVWSVWLTELFKKGALNYMDAVSIHPYRINNAPETILNSSYARVRALIDKYATSYKPLFVTEIGWTTANISGAVSNPSTTAPLLVTEAVQGAYVSRSILLSLVAGIPHTCIYELTNSGVDSTNTEHNFGLMTADGIKKPAFYNVQQVIADLSDYKFESLVPTPENVFAIKFINDELDVKIAAWTINNSNMNVTLENKTVFLTGIPFVFTLDNKHTPSVFSKSEISSILNLNNSNDYVINSAVGLDANNLLDGNWYFCDGTTLNTPNNYTGYLNVIGVNAYNQRVIQEFRRPGDDYIYTRSYNQVNGVYEWTPWKKVMTTEDIYGSQLEQVTLATGIGKNFLCTYKKSVIGENVFLSISLDITNVTNGIIGSIKSSYAPIFAMSKAVRGSGGQKAYLTIQTDGTLKIDGIVSTDPIGINCNEIFDLSVQKI